MSLDFALCYMHFPRDIEKCFPFVFHMSYFTIICLLGSLWLNSVFSAVRVCFPLRFCGALSKYSHRKFGVTATTILKATDKKKRITIKRKIKHKKNNRKNEKKIGKMK